MNKNLTTMKFIVVVKCVLFGDDVCVSIVKIFKGVFFPGFKIIPGKGGDFERKFIFAMIFNQSKLYNKILG